MVPAKPLQKGNLDPLLLHGRLQLRIFSLGAWMRYGLLLDLVVRVRLFPRHEAFKTGRAASRLRDPSYEIVVIGNTPAR